MSSSEVAFEVAVFVLERWADTGALLRVYRVFADCATCSERRVVRIDGNAKELVLTEDGGAPTTWDLTGARFKYVEEDEEILPAALSDVFVGRFLAIRFPNEDIFVLGELSV